MRQAVPRLRAQLGHRGSIKGANGNRLGAAPNDPLAKVFRQWVPFCSFTPTEAGDWYLQVRTNVRLDTSVSDGEGGYSGNQAVFNQAGDDTAVGGDGANRYAIRAWANGSAAGSISVSAYERMPIYANATGADTSFNLVRVIPAAAAKTLVFSFFDVGEGASGRHHDGHTPDGLQHGRHHLRLLGRRKGRGGPAELSDHRHLLVGRLERPEPDDQTSPSRRNYNCTAPTPVAAGSGSG